MYDPTYAHKITMTLYEDRLRLAAADAQPQPSAAIRALRVLLGRAVPRVAWRSTNAPAPELSTTTCAR